MTPLALRVLGLLVAICTTFFLPTARANTAPQAAGVPAGHADFVLGTVIAQGADGKGRLLSKGSPILSGDKILTNEGRIQLRFTDGAYVSLLPRTEFSVTDYRYDGAADGNETGFYALMRGTIRMVTGAIGRVHRARFQLSTPTATIGVRGTGGIIEVLGDGSTHLFGTSGIWTITNAAGTLPVPAGSAAIATPNPALAPQYTAQRPSGAPQSMRAANSSGASGTAKSTGTSNTNEQAEAASSGLARGQTVGTPTSGAPALPPASPLALASPVIPSAGQQSTEVLPPTGAGNNGGGTNNNAGGNGGGANSSAGGNGNANPPAPNVPLTNGTYTAAYTFGFQVQQGNAPTIVTGASVAPLNKLVEVGTDGAIQRIGPFVPASAVGEAGSDGIVGWGRWADRVADLAEAGTVRLGPQDGFHYVLGRLTQEVPTANSGVRSFTSYALTGATSPTIVGANVAPGVLGTANLGVDFTTGKLGLDLNLRFAGFGVAMSTTGGGNNPAQSNVTVAPGNATFLGQFANVSFNGDRPANLCPTGCTGSFQGFFAGDAAARAGIVYGARGAAGSPEVQGAAVFTKQ